MGGAGTRLPHRRQGSDGSQLHRAGDQRRPGDLSGHRERPAGDRPRRRGGRDVPALLHRVMFAGAAPVVHAGLTDGRTSELQSLVTVLQLTDSAFPSGRYTLSYGLEALVQTGHLTVPSERSTLTRLLRDSIRYGAAPSDG